MVGLGWTGLDWVGLALSQRAERRPGSTDETQIFGHRDTEHTEGTKGQNDEAEARPANRMTNRDGGGLR